MLYLRLFIIYPDAGGDLQAHISSEFEEFKRLWDDLILNGPKPALVHVGFTRLDNEEIIQVFRRNPGKILLTSSAVSILSNLLEIKTSFLESLFKENFFLLGSPTVNELNLDSQLSLASEVEIYPEWVIKGNSFNWFRNLEEIQPELAAMASHCGIKDDLSYQANEARLPTDIRVEIAYARSIFIRDVTRLSRIRDLPRIFPPWTLSNSINIFNFSVRTRKRMEMQNINLVSDFTLYSDEELLRIPGIGIKVMNEIRTALVDYATLILGNKTALLGSIKSDSGGLLAAVSRLNFHDVNTKATLPAVNQTQDQEALLVAAQSGNLLKAFELLVSSLKGPQKTVIEHRSGLEGPPKTLREVATIIGTTRERVRQIQQKASYVLDRQSNLSSQLRQRLDDVRKSMVVPLKISTLSSYDSWFEDCDGKPLVFEFILDLFDSAQTIKSPGYIVSSYKDLGIILKGDVDTLGQSIKDLIDYVKDNANKGITKAQIKEKIEYIAAIDTPELIDFIFYEVTDESNGRLFKKIE